MFAIRGQITARLTDQLDRSHPAWTPVRGSDVKPLHLAQDGWHVTGRPKTPGAGR